MTKSVTMQTRVTMVVCYYEYHDENHNRDYHGDGKVVMMMKDETKHDDDSGDDRTLLPPSPLLQLLLMRNFFTRADIATTYG